MVALMRSLRRYKVQEILERNWQFEFIMCRMDLLETGIKLIANKEIGKQEAEGGKKKSETEFRVLATEYGTDVN